MEQKICPVDVISMCSADGKIQPLRFRMEDESHQRLRVDIQQIVSVQEIHHVGVEAQVFLCKAKMWGREWVFQLKYNIRAHSWCLLWKNG